MATWTDNVLDFAEALQNRAASRSEPFFRAECRADVEYLKKAAQLLEMVTRAYIRLSVQLNESYEQDTQLSQAAREAIEIVEKQIKMQLS